MIAMVKRMFWAATWRLCALGLIALAIAISWNSSGQMSATTTPNHPQLATELTALAPVEFGHAIPGLTIDTASAEVKEQLEIAGTPTLPAYVPREEVVPAHPTNYGPRYLTDIYGNPVNNALVVVIHETVGSASSAINLFRTAHPRDADQRSYHSIIKRDGTIVHLVHPQMRAFGAGNSVFDGANGPEAVRTNPDFPPSVNNFAYHTSLESPSDGRGNQSAHSGYTDAQYQSLAWLVAHLPVANDRITTHRAVDRSGSRRDPRSFDSQKFITLLSAYPRSYENFQ